MTDEEDMKSLLDDDDIRKYFKSRDPERKKPVYYSDDDTVNTKGKATSLKPKEDTEEVHGVSFTQHVKHIKETARHFSWLGIAIGMFIAIVITLLT